MGLKDGSGATVPPNSQAQAASQKHRLNAQRAHRPDCIAQRYHGSSPPGFRVKRARSAVEEARARCPQVGRDLAAYLSTRPGSAALTRARRIVVKIALNCHRRQRYFQRRIAQGYRRAGINPDGRRPRSGGVVGHGMAGPIGRKDRLHHGKQVLPQSAKGY